MNAKTNKGKRIPSPRRKAQGSMEYIIILAVVIIGAIIAGVLYLHSMSHTQIGNAESLVAAGSSAPTELTLALSEPLPTSATGITIDISGSVTPVTANIISSGAGSLATPSYTNNYPEYVFTTTPPSGTNSIAVDNVTGMTYQLNGQQIAVSTSTGQPLSIQPITGNIVTP